MPEARQPERRIVLQGDIPSPIDLPRGMLCFASRCPQAIAGRDATQPGLYRDARRARARHLRAGLSGSR